MIYSIMIVFWKYTIIIICSLAIVNSCIKIYKLNFMSSDNNELKKTGIETRYYILIIIVSIWLLDSKIGFY